MKTLIASTCLLFGIGIAATAAAQTPTAKKASPATPAAKEAPAAPAAAEAEKLPATFDAVGAKLCAGIEKREASGEKSSFATGEKAYLWLKLRPNATKTESPRMKIRWSWNDKPYWTMDEVAVRWGRSWYYKTVDQPGDWKAELIDENDTVVTTVSFNATGEPYVRPKAEEEAPAQP